MNEMIPQSRRSFVRQAAGAAALVPLAAVPTSPAAVAASPAAAPKAAKIRIGTRISTAWLQSENDNDLRFLKQIGVDYVDIELSMVQGYRETGSVTKEALHELITRFDAVGLRIERANALGPQILNAHLGRPEGQREIDQLKRIGELLCEAEIPVYGIQACQATDHVTGGRAGWSRKKGRGGYEYPEFDADAAERAAVTPKAQVTADQLWKGLINIYTQVVPVVEGSKTKIAMHGNDPPLYQYLGSPQILCRFADFDRLFAEVPSRHSGITFCVGTRYESGEDVFTGLRHFGEQGKLMHVHFRNVRNTLPVKHGYEEVCVDDGDLDMAKVVRTLQEVGYDGVIDYDHPITINGDRPLPKQYIAFAVGYMRGLLHSLPA
jgi:D-mannonate dehydratase